MMHFTTLTVPALTPENNPVRVRINTRQGWVRYCAVSFPAGTNDAVKVRLSDAFQTFGPSGGWLSGDGERVDWPERYRAQGPPYQLNVEAYSDSAATDYTIRVLVVVE
jgi:hypothetical protein